MFILPLGPQTSVRGGQISNLPIGAWAGQEDTARARPSHTLITHPVPTSPTANCQAVTPCNREQQQSLPAPPPLNFSRKRRQIAQEKRGRRVVEARRSILSSTASILVTLLGPRVYHLCSLGPQCVEDRQGALSDLPWCLSHVFFGGVCGGQEEEAPRRKSLTSSSTHPPHTGKLLLGT